ncbi:MAG TPA: DUF4870 domain-containing protein [Candidatus Microbacterium pullistercoris]|nr:DUF4870 domain-containing protein [Candidatus Microbacterium pullistercoris]
MTDNPTDPQQGAEGAPGAVPPQQPQGQQQPTPPQPPQQPQSQPTPPPAPQQQPPQGYPQQPPQGYPQQQPPQGYPQQPPHGYPQQPQGGYQQPAYGPPADNSNLQLNLWLSVFFAWLPALIFFLIEKDKVDPATRKAVADNLNFQLIRTIAMVAALLIIWIPILGQLLYIGVAIAGLVIAIMHAVKVPPQVQTGQYATFMVTPSWVK